AIDRVWLIAAIVEDHQHVRLAHVDELLGGPAAVRVHQPDAWAQQVELAGEISGEVRANASAEDHDPAPDVGQHTDRLVYVAMREQAQGRLKVVDRDFERVAEHPVGAGALGLVAIAGQRRAQPGLDLEAEALLELRIAMEAELGDEPGHGGWAHPGPLSEPGDTLQAGDRVGREQSAGQPALGRAQAVEALPDDLPDPGVSACDVCYILVQSSAPGTSLTTNRSPASFAAKPQGKATREEHLMSVQAQSSDVETLHRMGYAQELMRRMSGFSKIGRAHV